MLLLRIAVAAVLALTSSAIQPSANNPVDNQELRDLEWGELNFLHTTDQHGWHGGHLQEAQYSADLGDYISFMTHMRQRAKEKGVDLLVIDTGDRVEGNGLYDASNPAGLYTRRLFEHFDVDLLTTGNHELYNGTTAFHEHTITVPFFGDRYLSSNIDINVDGEWKPFANRTLNFQTENLGLNIVAFGFLFNFTGNYKNTRVKPVATVLEEEWFQTAIRQPDVDVFLVAAHIDVRTLELQQIHDAIRKVNPETPIQILGGHSHIRDFKVFDEKSTALESGRYCETAGFLSLTGLLEKDGQMKAKDGGPLKTFRRYIDFNRIGFQHHSGTDEDSFDTPEGLGVSSDITLYRQTLKLNRLIGCAPRDFSLYRDPYPSPGNWYSYLAETILPEMVRNPTRAHVPHMIFINGGSQRFDIYRGPFTYDTSFLVSPFTSRFYFARDIPYNVATQLLDYFNNDPSPYSAAMEAKGELKPPKPEADYTQPPFADRQQTILSKQYRRIKGYTTNDDFGHSGDDTVHDHFDKYPPPKVIQANSTDLSEAEESPDVVDVVFFDFIAENVAAGLNTIVGKEEYSAKQFEMYMGHEDTLTKLLLEFVETRWGKDCV